MTTIRVIGILTDVLSLGMDEEGRMYQGDREKLTWEPIILIDGKQWTIKPCPPPRK